MSTANRTWTLTGAALALLGLAAGYVAARWEDWVAPAMVGSLVLVLGASLAMVVALARKQNNTPTPSTNSEEHYKWGMFYYNPVRARRSLSLSFWCCSALFCCPFYFDAHRNPALSAFITPL